MSFISLRCDLCSSTLYCLSTTLQLALSNKTFAKVQHRIKLVPTAILAIERQKKNLFYVTTAPKSASLVRNKTSKQNCVKIARIAGHNKSQ